MRADKARRPASKRGQPFNIDYRYGSASNIALFYEPDIKRCRGWDWVSAAQVGSMSASATGALKAVLKGTVDRAKAFPQISNLLAVRMARMISQGVGRERNIKWLTPFGVERNSSRFRKSPFSVRTSYP